MTERTRTVERLTPGAERVLLTASVIVPSDSAMPLERIEAFLADALRHGGFFVRWTGAEFVKDDPE